jgi:cytochrome b pre-mRNA-processing protein 3
MIFQFFRRTRDDPSIASLYGAIVAQARAKTLYQRFGVPDTVNGRLEMILLHAILLLRRLNDEPDGAPWGQAVFDQFCQDMDDNLREMGVGDLAVPKEMRRIGEAFYGRQAAYTGALASSDPQALVEVLKRNVLDGGEGAQALAGYVRAAARALAARELKELRMGNLGFPDPAEIDNGLDNRTDNGTVAGKDSARTT